MSDHYPAWTSRHLNRPLLPIEQQLVELVCDALRLGPWNLSWTSLVGHEGGYAHVAVRDDRLSTFDTDGLTRLVVLAHDRCLRVQVTGDGGPGRVRISITPRVREGDIMHRHPTMEQAVAAVRASSWSTPK